MYTLYRETLLFVVSHSGKRPVCAWGFGSCFWVEQAIWYTLQHVGSWVGSYHQSAATEILSSCEVLRAVRLLKAT